MFIPVFLTQDLKDGVADSNFGLRCGLPENLGMRGRRVGK
jgi:hypothetical protein